jgi:putative transposase
MGRIARVVIPGCWHHVTQRGNRRQTVFFDDADRKLYLDLLRRYCARYEVAVAGYCLMSNHVHSHTSPVRRAPSAGPTTTTPAGKTRADMATAPEEWPWPSARAHLDGGDASGLLDTADWAACSSVEGWRERLVESSTDAAMLERIREATRTGRPAGGEAFLERAASCTGRRLRPDKPGPKRAVATCDAQLGLETV